MRMRRVLYVHNSADLYGASRSLLRLLGRLPRDRFVPLVVLPEDGPLRKELERLEVAVHIRPGLAVITRPVYATWGGRIRFVARLLRSALDLRALIRREGVSLVHTNTGVVASSGLAARLAGVGHVWHLRDWFQEFRSVWPLYARYMRWSADALVAVSTAVAKQFPEAAGVQVVHNGFSMDEFACDHAEVARTFRERYGLGAAFVVGCVGRIKQVRKGQEILVEAAALLRDRGRTAKYVIIGSAHPGYEDHQAALERLIAARSLVDSVVLTGEIWDVRSAYPAMDVLVLPSVQPEPFGGVVMEGMAMGVPVVATAVGGSTEQVDDGVTGLLIPPGDPVALAAALESLMADPDLLRRMAIAAPLRVSRRFSLDEMMARLTGIYEHVLAAR